MRSTPDDDHASRLERALRIKKALAESRHLDISPRPPEEEPRLGAMQQSLWLVHQMNPHSAAYNLVSAFSVSEALDLSRLESSLREVLSRHRILRSTFRTHDHEVVQVVSPEPDGGLEVLTVEPGEVLDTARRKARQAFNLTEAPLIRMVYVGERSGSEAMLLLVMHHLLADEMSLGILWEQLAQAYRGESLADPAEIQFDDFVYWQGQQMHIDRDQEVAFWSRQLDPLPDELILPFERPRPQEVEPRGKLLRKRLDSRSAQGIQRLAAGTSSTPFTVYAFAFRLLLERYMQGQRIAFATPVTTRSHPAALSMIGYFLNPMVIAVAIDERKSVEEAVRLFAAEIQALLAHSLAPFHVLAEALSPPRAADRHPIFQVMFVYQQAGDPVTLGDVQLSPVELDLGESKFDLTLFVSAGPTSVDVGVEYRSDRFDQVWMENLLGHYERLLIGLAANEKRATADVPLLTAGEESQLSLWQGRAEALDSSPLLPDQILETARQSPEATAVICGGVRWSYADLERIALGIGGALQESGVEPGDHVGLFLDRSPWMIAGLLACHWVGAAYVPLDPTYPRARNHEVLEDARVSAVLTMAELSANLGDGDWSTLLLDEIEAGGRCEVVASEGDTTAYVLYTSGSTGRPKGVVVTQGNLGASTAARLRFYEAPPKRFLLLPSVAFDSSVAGIFWTLMSGGTLVIPTDEEILDSRRLARIVAEEEVDSLLCVPSLYATLLKAGGQELAGLEFVIVAGETCTSALVKEHFRALPQVRLFNEYGPTEATVWATVHEVTADDAARPVAIGHPIPGVEVEVLDQLGRAVPTGVPGQAWIAGPTVARGYWRRDEASTGSFVDRAEGAEHRGRRYRTGDLMAWDTEGRLHFLGRQDDQIKLRGFRIEPGEIEATLLEHPAIEQVVVMARSLGDSTAGPQHLVAFVCRSEGARIDGWGDLVADRLPAFMVPRKCVDLVELPRLPNGKVDRERLRTMPLEAEAVSANQQSATNDVELALQRLWQGLLGRADFGVTDNFFELGGHSLLVVEMATAIEQELGTHLTPAEIFQSPTVRQLARGIDEREVVDSPEYAHLFPIQPGGQGTPLIVAIPHVFTEMFASRFRGERPVYGLRGVGIRPEGNRGRWPTMADLGNELVDEIQRRFPGSPCIMAGYSFGASMAVEAVRLMEERGIPVQGLYLISPMPLNHYQVGPTCLQLDHLCKPVEELSAGEVWSLLAKQSNPLTRRVWARARRLLMVQPWRHLLCGVGKLRQRLGLPLTPRGLFAEVRIERFRLHSHYRPGTVYAPTVIFNPAESEEDIAATWRSHFGGPYTVVDTPDPHLGDEAIERAKLAILAHLDEVTGR